MTAIHADGRVYCSNAVIAGRFRLRVCIVNLRASDARRSSSCSGTAPAVA
jgi:hypothetical protein